MQEIWKPAPGFEGRYEVSSFGNVARIVDGNRCQNRKIGAYGGFYAQVSIGIGGNRSKAVFVHRLVARAFLGPRPSSDHQINHIDGNKLNNRAENLEWVTALGNSQHAIGLGLVRWAHGERHCAAKMTVDDVHEIRRRCSAGIPHAVIAADYSIHRASVYAIAVRKSWKHV